MALCVPLFQFIRSISWTHEKNNKSFSKKSFDVQFSTKIGCRALEIFNDSD